MGYGAGTSDFYAVEEQHSFTVPGDGQMYAVYASAQYRHRAGTATQWSCDGFVGSGPWRYNVFEDPPPWGVPIGRSSMNRTSMYQSKSRTFHLGTCVLLLVATFLGAQEFRGNPFPRNGSVWRAIELARFYAKIGSGRAEARGTLVGNTNMETARICYEFALSKLAQQPTDNKLSNSLTGEFGWFLVLTEKSLAAEEMVLAALKNDPTNANLNAKAAIIAFQTANRSTTTQTEKDTLYQKSKEYYEASLKSDPTYAYSYWGLSQIYGREKNVDKANHCREQFIELFDRTDREIWLYDEREFLMRLEAARDALQKAAASEKPETQPKPQ